MAHEGSLDVKYVYCGPEYNSAVIYYCRISRFILLSNYITNQ